MISLADLANGPSVWAASRVAPEANPTGGAACTDRQTHKLGPPVATHLDF